MDLEEKLAIYVLNAFICEWSNDGGVYSAQHLIHLKANHRKHQLFGIKIPWPCTKVSLKKQIRHWMS